jgi:hypothetical protein
MLAAVLRIAVWRPLNPAAAFGISGVMGVEEAQGVALVNAERHAGVTRTSWIQQVQRDQHMGATRGGLSSIVTTVRGTSGAALAASVQGVQVSSVLAGQPKPPPPHRKWMQLCCIGSTFLRALWMQLCCIGSTFPRTVGWLVMRFVCAIFSPIAAIRSVRATRTEAGKAGTSL